MTLFNEYETTGYVFIAIDDDETKIATFADDYETLDADFEVDIFIHRMGAEDAILFESEGAEYRANIEGANANLVKQGHRIKVGSEIYEVTNVPKYLRLFGRYSLRLRRVND